MCDDTTLSTYSSRVEDLFIIYTFNDSKQIIIILSLPLVFGIYIINLGWISDTQFLFLT